MVIPITDEARWLMTAGALAAARLHARGMPIDLEYCHTAQKQLLEDMRAIEADAWKIEGGKEWVKEYGAEASIGDANQARHMLYDVLKLPLPDDSRTKSGLQGIGKEVLDELDHPIVDAILEYRKRDKAANTSFAGIIREAVDGVIHPFFHVCGSAKGEDEENTVTTYRTSSSDPNFQNMPIRDPVIGAMVRRAFRAPPGWCIVEADYCKIEVHANTWYHKDNIMIKYLVDDYDMHSDMARECYMLTMDEYNHAKPKPKVLRNAAKGDYTFAEFYGSYWPQVSKRLYKDIRQLKMTLGDGTPLKEHLKRKGILELGVPRRGRDGKLPRPAAGTYAGHILEVENRFWNQRFPGYGQWRKDFYAKYQTTGSFTTLAGFHHEGHFRKNQVINTPGQGTASHCKMRALIGLTTETARVKMDAFPNAEIHDSLLALVRAAQVEDYMQLAYREMITKVRAAWPWIITPIGVEFEVTPPGGTWFEKAPRSFIP